MATRRDSLPLIHHRNPQPPTIAHRNRAADRERSSAWWQQRLARGICAACRRPLPDDWSTTWPVHRACGRLAARGVRYAAIRQLTPAQIEEQARPLEQP